MNDGVLIKGMNRVAVGKFVSCTVTVLKIVTPPLNQTFLIVYDRNGINIVYQ
jgi:hypothetical protein